MPLDDQALIERCRDGDLDACRDLVARHSPAALRVAYLLTGNREWAIELVSTASLDVLRAIRRQKRVEDVNRAVLRQVLRFWRDQSIHSVIHPERVSENVASGARLPKSTSERSIQQALARLDDHQRAVIALHLFGGVQVEQLADALDISAELIYIQVVVSREVLVQAADLEQPGDLLPALNRLAMSAPRLALWPEIEPAVRRCFNAEEMKQRYLSIGVTAAVVLVLLFGALFIGLRGGDAEQVPIATTQIVQRATPVASAAFSILPTATPTPVPNVSDTLVFSSQGANSRQTWLFDRRLEEFPLLGEDVQEAGAPVVSPDGRHVYLIWYAFEDGRVTGYVAAFDGDLTSELWRVALVEDDDAETAGRFDFRLSLAVDHQRVYVARQAWLASDLVEIDVLRRADGSLEETIATNLAGFAAHDIRLYAPPGSNQINLFAITNEAPPESGALQITFLAYAVPGGEKLHGRILFDQPDSRTFFLYDSQLVTGTDLLFGVEHTQYYRQLAVHLFDLRRGSLQPRIVIPFQPVANPLPYQHAVSHDGHWLYVLSSASLEVAVFNLFDQALVGIVPLDPGVLQGHEIGVGYPQGRSMQISPDGSRIYAEGTLEGVASGIWVIDAATWTIVNHWLPDTRPAEILLSGDGQILYARIPVRAAGAPGESSLVAVDTKTGEPQELDLVSADRFSLESISTLFQRTYASSPAIEGQGQISLVSTEPLAAAQVEVSQPNPQPGSVVTVEVAFVHPLTGDPVGAQSGGARYLPPDGVRAIWTLEGRDVSTILELGRSDFGLYQGFLQLSEPGDWTLRVEVDWPVDTIADRTIIREQAARIVEPVTADGSPSELSPSG